MGDQPITEAITPLIERIQLFILRPIIALLFGFSLIIFLWGTFQFLRNSGSSSGREQGGRHILYGVIGMFIMVSVYGIITLILNTIGAPAPDSLP